MIDMAMHRPYLLFMAFIISGLFIGLLLQNFILNRIKAYFDHRHSYYTAAVVKIVRIFSVYICIIITCYLGLYIIDFRDPARDLLEIAINSVTIILTTLIVAELSVSVISISRRRKEVHVTTLLQISSRLLIYVSGSIILLNYLNIQITPILTALGVGGLAVALALQDTLSNLFAGLHILAARQLRPNDYIKLESGEEGYVVDVNWRNTEIRTIFDNIVIVPNSKVASNIIVNYTTLTKTLIFPVLIGVDYSCDLEKAEQVALEEAKKMVAEHPNIPDDFEPYLHYRSFGESSVNFEIYLMADEYFNHYIVKHAYIKRVHNRFKQEGIVIPFPVRTVYLKK